MIINHNMASLNTYNKLSANNASTSKSLEKLSSGLRINRSGDDAAGLAISEKMRSQIRGLDQAGRNAQDGISLLQTAEGALSETHSILQRMNELAVQASTGTMSATDSAAAQAEVVQLNSEIDRIATTTQFNGKVLLNGTLGTQVATSGTTSGIQVGTASVTSLDIAGAAASTVYTLTSTGVGKLTLSDTSGNSQQVSLADGTAGVLNFDKLGVKIGVSSSWTSASLRASAAGAGTAGTVSTTASAAVAIQIGANSGETLGVSIGKMDSTALGINAIDISTAAGASAAITTIQGAVNQVSTERAKQGAYQNRLEHTITNLATSSENTTAAESRIRDVDMAKEMMNFQKNSILSQAATAMLAQANQQPQGVLQLLR